jgi:GNAT superfamily N-acetyltransferase
MIAFATAKLVENRIASIRMELDAGPTKGSETVKGILARHNCGPDDAQPFNILLNAYDDSGALTRAVGFVEGVYHKTPLLLEGIFSRCRQVVYLHVFFIEDDCQKYGIATSVLDCLPKLIGSEMGGIVDAVVLAPVPQYKAADGKVVQMPLGLDFFIAYRKLIGFYAKRGFRFTQSMSMMGKPVGHDENYHDPGMWRDSASYPPL